MSHYILTSEQVGKGHPDKVADQISDAILDAYLLKDSDARVACEVMVKNNTVYVCGEITSYATIGEGDIQFIVREAIHKIGYTDRNGGFDADTCSVVQNISQQSPEIGRAVIGGAELTAGDQGIMFGYATRETPTFMPITVYLAREIVDYAWNQIGDMFSNDCLFKPDMKSQVSIEYDGQGNAVRVHSVVFSVCHDVSIDVRHVREYFHDKMLPTLIATIPEHIRGLFDKDTVYYVNPAGAWHIGGPVSDCGLTGRKIVVDQYGAECEVGGGAFSGKDPLKQDRSGAYMARRIALQTLHDHADATRVKVQLAYAIGEKFPVSYRITDPVTKREFGLGRFKKEDLTPQAIIDFLQLRNPIYWHTAHFGHFGVRPFSKSGIEYYTWERYE